MKTTNDLIEKMEQAAEWLGKQAMSSAASQHTPGPWKACVDPLAIIGTRVLGPTGTNGRRAICKPYGSDAPANARLIAAAPDLLAVARLSLINAEGEIYQLPARLTRAEETRKIALQTWCGKLRAAIAKTEGRV